jgi:hypothetical protein
MAKLKVISMNRYRAAASVQRALGLKVGGAVTEFSVSDGKTDMLIEAWGATPGQRSTAAKLAFELGREVIGTGYAARIKWRKDAGPSPGSK